MKAKTLSHASATTLLLKVKEENWKRGQAPGSPLKGKESERRHGQVIQFICTPSSSTMAAVTVSKTQGPLSINLGRGGISDFDIGRSSHRS